ncbi:hypothetical membrane protein [Solidesulfovibrio magneticus RS-1]|uniref:Hypothetical membrane protein n=1 Tax=Solidesulfovibrio magneticus (strain ATCC 700980 / DSM 13731 / RS-1) TaxID=573370 RepID=C4XPR8_SOLM1|nr:hypothetical membrane protein [Solidesulfovibrio magneticus RS-1]
MRLLLTGVASLDRRVAAWMARVRSPRLTRFMRLATQLGAAPLCLTTYVAAFFLSGPVLAASALAMAQTEALLLPAMAALRLLTRRPRPLPAARPCLFPWNRSSFPSWHAARTAMIATILTAHIPGAAAPAWTAAALVWISRSYLGRHYISDIVCGGLLGAAAAAALAAA